MSEEVPVNLLGLCARWRSHPLREQPLPGVPWTCGEIGDHIAPILAGRAATQSHICAVASRLMQEHADSDEIRAVCAYVLMKDKR